MRRGFNFKAVLICFALFFFFLLIRFPFKNVRGYVFGKIYTATKIFIVADDLYPSFFGWPGIGIRNVDVTIPLGRTDWNLSSEKLIFRVGLGGLFPPIPSVSLSLKKLKKGGDLYLWFAQGKERLKASWEAEDVTLDQLFGGETPGKKPMEGKLNADGDLDFRQKEPAKSTGSWDINITGLKTPANFVNMTENYGFLVPALDIGPVKGKLVVKNGVAEFQGFTIGTPTSDVRGTITGDVRLGADIMQSMVNITLKLQIANKIMQNPQAQTFVSFVGGYQTATPGDYAMKWSATVQELSDLSIKILPRKINE